MTAASALDMTAVLYIKLGLLNVFAGEAPL
jgi:hypothetical protein